MWFYNCNGKVVNVSRKDFTTDAEYYSKILLLRYGIVLESGRCSADDIYALI